MSNDPLLDFCESMFERSSDGVAIIDRDGVVLRANRAFARLYADGDASHLVGRFVWELLPPNQQEAARAQHFELFNAAESSATFETIVPTGSPSSALIETTVYFNEPVGARTKALFIARDITEKTIKARRELHEAELDLLKAQFQELLAEQKRVEQRLLESQAELRNSQRLFESIAKHFPNGAINVLDRNYRFVFTDGQEYRKYDIDPASLVGSSLDDLFPNQDLSAPKALYDKVFQGEPQRFEFEHSGYFYENVAVPLPDEQGVIDRILTVTLNITEKKKAEAAVQDASARIAALVHNIPGVVFQAETQPDLSTKMTFVSENARQFGVSPEEILAADDFPDSFIHPDDRRSFAQARLASQQTLKPLRWEGRALIRGKTFWIEVAATPRRAETDVVYWEGVVFDISERKKIEADLLDAMRIANISTVEVDLVNRQLIYSDRHFEQLGTTVEQFGSRAVPFKEVGKSGLVHPDDMPILAAQLAKAEQAKTQGGFVNEPFEYRIRRGDTGEIRTLYVFKTEIFRDESGNAMRAIATIQDITERKALENALRALNESLERQVQERTEALRQSESLYRAIAENYPSGAVGIYDRALTLLFTDGMEYRRVGIDAKSLIGKNLRDIYPKPEADIIAQHLEKAFAGETVNFEVHLFGNDYFYIVSPLCDGDKTIERVLVITQNIAERKQAERRLRESEERHRLVVEQTGQLVYDWDLTTNSLTWSGAIERLTGYAPSEYNLSLEEWAKQIHPDDRERATRSLEETMRTGEPYHAEYRYRRKDGSYFWVEDSGVFIKDSSGKSVRMLGAMKDVTTQKEMELEKRRLAEKAMQSQKMEAIGTLASGVAHEFNNLLAIISLASEQMARYPDATAIVETAQTIQKTVARGKHIARQLLDFSRAEQPEKCPVELWRLVDEIATTLRRLLKKNVTVQAARAVDQAWIMGNDKQLYQVLLNLGINAGDAMPRGGTLTFSLSTSRYGEKDYAVIRVKDTGTGMSPDVKARIFEPFFTTKGPGKGTGLGLSVAHGIVTAHDGRIEVESELGKGTTFTLIFPLLERAQPSVSETRVCDSAAGCETLLVVEDEEFLRLMLVDALRSKGYAVIEACNGEEALRIFEARQNEIDLVLTDIGMPNLDGYELLQKIRSRRADAKVVAMSGYMDLEQAQRLAKAGIDVVSKPFDFAEISMTIRNVLMR